MEFARLNPEVQQLIREVAEEEGFKQPEFAVSPGSKAGDNYMGIVHRVVLKELQNGRHTPNLSLIVKCPPDNAIRRERFRSVHMFANEAVFYNEIIPAFISFQKQKGITSNLSPPHPRCLRAGQLLVMEDQMPLGFSMRKRQEPLDSAHCLLIMRELGRLHAVSFALRDQRPTLFQRLSTSIEETVILKKLHPAMTSWFLHIFQKATNKFVECSHVTNKSKYVDAMKKMEIGYYDKVLELVNPTNSEPYAVINHADCWTNNVLFKYRKGCKEPESLCLLDFQVARFASPACDLTFFLFCCTDKSTRDTNYQDMLQEYHSSLASHLANLGSDADTLFPMEALQDQMRRFGRFGMLMALGLVPMFTCNSDEIPDLDEACMDDAKSFDAAFDFDHSNAKQCWERICDIIVDAVDYGYMD